MLCSKSVLSYCSEYTFIETSLRHLKIKSITPEVMQVLQEKHPKPEPINTDVFNQAEPAKVEEVLFEAIDSSAIQKVAKNVNGSGGPTKIDADILKHMLCLKIINK